MAESELLFALSDISVQDSIDQQQNKKPKQNRERCGHSQEIFNTSLKEVIEAILPAE